MSKYMQTPDGRIRFVYDEDECMFTIKNVKMDSWGIPGFEDVGHIENLPEIELDGPFEENEEDHD